jgi:DNA-binding transcriptional ArsR family regulator
MTPFEPLPILTISGPAETRAFLHPLRFRILRMLIGEALTVSAVARRLAVHPANLTHHFRLLSQSGLIRGLEERPAGRGAGRLYRAAALRFTLAGC